MMVRDPATPCHVFPSSLSLVWDLGASRVPRASPWSIHLTLHQFLKQFDKDGNKAYSFDEFKLTQKHFASLFTPAYILQVCGV